jgi:hypothetical protein
MMAERALATAYVNIVPGTQAVEQYLKTGLSGQAQGAGEKAGQSFGGGFKSKFSSLARGIMGPLLATASVAGVTNFLSGAVQGASDLNEQAAAVGQVFGKGAGAIDKFSNGASTSLGQTKTQVLEAAKSFGIFGKAAGLTGTDNAKFSTSLVSLATDLASFNNTSVDEALMALSSGLRGEAEPLRRYGVLLDDASLKAQAMSMGIYKGKGPLDQQAKILAANAVIFAQTATQQGDFARTSDGLANQQRILTASFADAQASLGQAFLPTMTTVVSFLNTTVIPTIKQFFEDFKAGKTPLNDIIAGFQSFGGWVVQNQGWLKTLGIILLTAWGAIKLVNTGFLIATTIQKGYAAAVTIVNGIMALWKIATGQATLAQLGLNASMLANPIGIVVAAVAALVAGLVWFFTQTKTGQRIWSGFTKFMGDSMKAVGKFFGDVWHGIQSAFTGVFDFIGRAFRGYVNTWVSLINFVIGGLNSLSMDIPDWVPLFGGQHWGVNIPKIPMLAEGGLVNRPTQAIIGEAGPEVVTPLKDFKQMMGIDGQASERPIYADGIGLLGWLREEAKGQATLVFNRELDSITRGAR